MSDTILSPATTPRLVFMRAVNMVRRTDRVLVSIAAIFVVIAIVDHTLIIPCILFTLDSLIFISPFLAAAVATAAAAKATGAEATIAHIFTGKPVRMIIAASLFGALSPFCSCGVIPIIAGLLGAGVPLAPVMAFWVSSPLMDPEMFILSAATLGVSFTTAKLFAAIGIGALAGWATHGMVSAGSFQSPLKEAVIAASCTGSCESGDTRPVWKFWREPARNAVFLKTSISTGLFLGKWLTVAFILENLMTVYLPATMIVDYLGSGQWWTIPLSVLASVPAYLNGYAAIPLMSRLLDMGMAPGAAMGFLLGGGITSIPAAIAVFVLVRRTVFLWYVALAIIGATGAAAIYQLAL